VTVRLMTDTTKTVKKPHSRSVGFAAALAGSGLVVSRGLGAVAAILASRVLTAADRGRYSLASTLGQALGIVLICGLYHWIPFELAANERHGEVAYVVRTVVLVCAVLSVLAVIVLEPFLATAVCLAIAWAVYYIVLSVATGLERFSLVALAGTVMGVTTAAGVAIATALHRASTERLVGIGALASVVGVAVSWPAVRSLGQPLRSRVVWR
jgi:hypothetical protein